jgi:DegV family protein with EDD domain
VTVGVVTDSAASLPDELLGRYGIQMVPMRIVMGGEDRPDGQVELGELVAHIGEGITTSAPSPGEFAQAIARADTGDGVVVATVASSMSATQKAAALAAQLSDGEVRVVDTGTAAGAEGLVALAAASAATGGGSLSAVEEAARVAAEHVRLIAVLGDLEHLVHSGRVPGIAAWAGRALGLQAMFEFRSGHAHPLRPASSRQRAFDRIVQEIDRSRVAGGRLHVTALHACAQEEAAALLERVARFEPEETFVAEFSSVMVAHTGPGVVGLAWCWSS